MRRDRCGGCGASDLEVFLDLGKTPLADRFPAGPDELEARYPLQVAVCTACWLVQLLEVVPDGELFGGDYGFYSAGSPSLAAYHRDYARWALDRFGDLARRLTVEIACNDGSLLRHFRDAGCPAYGIDPADGPTQAARQHGLEVITATFGREVAEELRSGLGAAGLIVANNVAAHVADLDDFFGGVRGLLAPDGVAVVEVQYLPDLLAGNQFDHVYHEHRFYFSGFSLSRVLARHGLVIDDEIHVPMQGGSVRFICRHSTASQYNGEVLGADERGFGVDRLETYRGFQGRVEYWRERMNGLLAGELVGARLAGYGATAKSSTLLNFLEAGPDLLEYVEDVTPAKIGRWTPGTHIPIVAPGERERPDVFLLLAWNYLPGVLRRERAFMDRGGRWLVPIPTPVLL